MRLPIFVSVLLSASFVFVFLIIGVEKAVGDETDTDLALVMTEPETGVETFPRLIENAVSVPELSAKAVYMQDVLSGEVLYEKNSDIPYFPASTTKMMTAMVAAKYYAPSTILEVPAMGVEGQKMGLVQGEDISVEALLYGTLVFSANDAAEVLARRYPGGREEFISGMNREAQKMGLVGSIFKNPTGLDQTGHMSTARDMARLGVRLMQEPYLSRIVGTEEALVRSTDERFVHKLSNINALLGEVDGVLGVKTGWTEGAGENLVTMVERGGGLVVIAVLGSDDRFGETRALIDWVYDNYYREGV